MEIIVVVLVIGAVFIGDEITNAVPVNLNLAQQQFATSVILLPQEQDGEDGNGPPFFDDSTTHALEHLSSAATCLVAKVEYTHGQQIYRADPCEFCLCLDGEMFCWWQDCPPTTEGICKDRGPFTPCINDGNDEKTRTTDVATSLIVTEQFENSTSYTDDEEITRNLTEITTSFEKEATKQVTACSVMGKKYQIGEKLPHNTGNCIECKCGSAGQVQCAPHQCAPAGDDVNDYRPPGPRQPDLF